MDFHSIADHLQTQIATRRDKLSFSTANPEGGLPLGREFGFRSSSNTPERTTRTANNNNNFSFITV